MTKYDENSPQEENMTELHEESQVAAEEKTEKKAKKAQEAGKKSGPSGKEAAELTDAEKYAQLEDKYLRVLAEYDNYRKRSQKEREGVFSEAVSVTVSALLPVLDNLQRAEASAQDGKGAHMIVKQFIEILEKMKVAPFGEPGEQFDPNLHHAIQHVEDEDAEENTIYEVMLKGYMIGDRVLRPALVKVAN